MIGIKTFVEGLVLKRTKITHCLLLIIAGHTLVSAIEEAPPSGSFSKNDPCGYFECHRGAITRGDTLKKAIALVFTGDEYADGGDQIQQVLKKHRVPASFFFTGRFYRNTEFSKIIATLRTDGHYLGAHSDKHLLYCDWKKRDSLFVTRRTFTEDLENNYRAMQRFGIEKKDATYFLPPYEWYNDTISNWTRKLNLHLINFTHGTLSHADYTTPGMPNYRSSEEIYNSILKYEESNNVGLNGFILLSHIGTAPDRTDKFYACLDKLLTTLHAKGYEFERIDELLSLEKIK